MHNNFPVGAEMDKKNKKHIVKGYGHACADGHMKSKKRAYQETVNCRIKDYKIMDNPFLQDLDKNYSCFFAVRVLVQLDSKQNSNLFDVL
jgi:hypothetical protein